MRLFSNTFMIHTKDGKFNRIIMEIGISTHASLLQKINNAIKAYNSIQSWLIWFLTIKN